MDKSKQHWERIQAKMKAIDLCDILERNYKKGEFQCNMDSCGNKPCDLCTVEKFEKEVRADERAKERERCANILVEKLYSKSYYKESYRDDFLKMFSGDKEGK